MPKNSKPYPRGRFPDLNVTRVRDSKGFLVEYFYHRRAKVRLHNRPGTPAFEAEYSRIDRGLPSALANHKAPRPVWIYFIRAVELGHVKIGKGSAPKLRLRHLQVASPDELRLEVSVYDASGGAFERELHERFKAARIRGEWFRSTPEIESLIDDLRAAAPSAPGR